MSDWKAEHLHSDAEVLYNISIPTTVVRTSIWLNLMAISKTKWKLHRALRFVEPVRRLAF